MITPETTPTSIPTNSATAPSFVFDDEKKRKVFDFSSNELSEFEANRRLGSPSHWRQYFAFEAPSYALKDSDISEFLKACSTAVKTAKTVLFGLLERKHDRRGHFVDLLLDRLLDLPKASLSQSEADGMLSVFALTMDDLARETKNIEEFGRSEIWRKGVRLLGRQKPSQFIELVPKAKAINWLSNVVRDQGFAHGLPTGNRSYPERQWLSQEELNEASLLITRRYETFGVSKILGLPSPLDVLYCWVQLGDQSIARQYLAAATRDDVDFLSAIEAMRGWQNSSATGVTYPLRDDVIKNFFDAEETRKRLSNLSQEGQNRKVRRQASTLLAAWQND